MIRMKVKHLVWTIVLMAGLIIAGVVGASRLDDQTAFGDISTYSVADAQREALKLSGMNTPMEDNLIYVGRDHSSYSHGVDNGPVVSLDDMVSRLEQLIQAFPNAGFVEMSKYRLAELYARQHRWDKAISLYEELLQQNDDEWRKGELELLHSREPQLGKTPMLSGKVMVGDRPLSGAEVYLRETDATSWNSPPRPEHHHMVLTDEHGEFRFYDIPESKYDIGVGASVKELRSYTYSGTSPHGIMVKAGEPVKDVVVRFNPNMIVEAPKGITSVTGDLIRLQWEPYPGAAYYKLQWIEVGPENRGNGYFTLPDQYEESEIVLDIAALREYVHEGWGYSSYGGDRENEWINPSYILGYAYPGSKYLWSVEAYDQNDNKISSSRPLTIVEEKDLPMLVFDDSGGKGLHEGDRYVLRGEYERAKEVYEEDLDNPHALRVLGNMYLFGTKSREEREPRKALTYLERIQNPSLADLRLMKNAYERLEMETEAERVKKQIESMED